ncbi:ABC transporter ATP-binding protein/permease [Inconstantimicrobium porci]|uniref:ABC transporter ATP-binding protein/permease n=2 Tax=Inconstantimicrobium porci TaxID=2652291 RepID=UPI0024099976|nr:ABC transporter ATP-binding protein/permease [Inconstantimicrobium porci]MDD6772234.1 ATP-binding cassette domain-containing protein [Inconstantimicrobium porci]
MKLLELKNVNKYYNLAGTQRYHALTNVNVSFEKGELVSIIGESGSGKSTLMNLIGGLDSDFSGELLVEGKNIGTFSEKELDRYRKNKIGFVFQSFNLIPHLSVLDNVTIAMTLSNVSKDKRVKRAEEILKDVGLEKHIHKKPNQLSGGQKQRVAIARALINDPEIIVADEPTGALDSQTTSQVLDIITDIARSGKLVIMVTHSEKVASYSSRVIEISDGQIVADKKGIDIDDLNVAEVSADTAEKDKQNLSFFSSIKLAFLNMKEKKTRNILVSLGSSIGIMSVILMLSIGNGVKGYFNNTMKNYVNPLVVEVNMPQDKSKSPLPADDPRSNMFSMMGSQTPFEEKDIEKLKGIKNVKSVEEGFNLISLGTNSVTYNDKKTAVMAVATISSNITSSNIKKGSLPKKDEIVLNEALAKKLGDDIVGKKITLNISIDEHSYKNDFTVSGIYSPGATTPMSDMDMTYVNYNDLKELLKNENYELKPTTMYLITDNKNYTEGIKSEIEKLGYGGSSQEIMTKMFTQMIDMITYVLAGISGISLLVSAIMILVVLYISVVERTKEIGVLKAIGARRKDIKRIFVSEAFLIGLFSGVIALGISSIIMMAANTVSNKAFGINVVNITPAYALFGVGASIIISMIAGIMPASKAAKLDPVESLRRE